MDGPVVEEPVHGSVFPPGLFGLPGLERLRLLLSAKVAPSPVRHLTGIQFTELGPGTVTFTMPITGWLRTPQGIATAGSVAILADLPLASAIQTVLPPATDYVTTELSMTTVPAGTAYAPTDLRTQFIRPIPADGGSIIARASVVHRGRSVAMTRAEVTNEKGKLLALANSPAVILPGRRADLADEPQY